ncbi:MAG: response regulator [Deltaproteobacteria bacterium]|nr:response regulator [Deltaproteobacteria bacterium]
MRTKRRILLVDDEPLVREELGALLVEEGYDVTTASDGEEGLDLFRAETPDMVISDIRMPRRDGLAVALVIRAEAPDVPVTVITGHGTESMAIQALRAGVTDFIKKPVRLDDLSAALNRMEDSLRLARHESVGMPGSVRQLERSWLYQLGNDLEAIAPFVDQLLRQCAAGFEKGSVTELSLALRELLLNAMEHGNLGLSYEDKSRALEAGALDRLLADRLKQPAYRDRRTTVSARRRDDELELEVTDEGNGFDWQSLPDPTDPANFLSDHGRGVLLARLSVDEIAYNERGNRVTVRKKLRSRS